MCGFPAGLRRLAFAAVCFLAALTVGATAASAQSDRGTIQGIVTDQSGAVVPDAKVEIRHLATGTVTSITTNEGTLHSTEPARSATTWCSSPRTASRRPPATGINLRSGVQIRVDLVLNPAGVTETVAVEASALDSSTITNTTALSEKLVEELPVIVGGNKRDITGFLPTFPASPAARPSTRGRTAPTLATPKSSSTAAAASQMISRGSLAENGPSLEQVGEFSVVSNGFNAEYGGFGIWFSNVTIKSGTNRFSGSVFDHYGTDAMNARTFFQAEKTNYKQHEGGFTLGGPVVLPGYNGRNKTFFFGSLGLFYSRVGSSGQPHHGAHRSVQGGRLQRPRRCPGSADSRSSTRRRLDRTAPAASSAISSQATGFPPTVSAKARREILDYLPTPDLPGNINNFRNRSSPTWPYYDIYTPIVKVDHMLTSAQRLSVMYTGADPSSRDLVERHGARPRVGRAPGQPDRQHVRSDRQQLEGSGQSRLRDQRRNLINHVTLSLDRYINRGQNKTCGPGLDRHSSASPAFPMTTARSPRSTTAAARLPPPISGAPTTRTGRTSAGVSRRA